MENQIKSGKEILNNFFEYIINMENIDKNIALSLITLYKEGKLTDRSVINELQKLREENDK
ncbi:MAG: hypothetical protein WAT71_00430 [Ignavibacteria bacterium]